jgi:hypothetical protein
MITFSNPQHFAQTVQFAANVGALDSLVNAIKDLDRWFDESDIEAVVYPDTMSDPEDPNFRFSLYCNQAKGRVILLHGGIIYSGPGRPSDGSAPSFTVSLDPAAMAGSKHQWSVHT